MGAFKNTIVFVIFVFWLLISVINIYTNTVDYFHYRIQTRLSYVRPVVHDLPSITMCAPKGHFITDGYYRDLFGDQIERPIDAEKLAIIERNLSQLSVGGQFDVMFDRKMLTQVIKCWDDSNGLVDCNRVHQFRRSISPKLYCLTLFQKDKSDTNVLYSNLSYDQFSHDSIYPLVTIEMTLKIPDVLLGLHSSQSPFVDIHQFDYKIVSLEPNRSSNLYYQTTQYMSLPEPYESSCHDYKHNNQSTNSREECIAKCKTSEWFKHFNCIPDESIFMISKEDSYLSSHFCSLDRELWSTNKRVLQKTNTGESRCNQLCRHKACYEEYYSVEVNSDPMATNPDTTVGHTIKIRPSKRPITVIVEEPELTFADYLAVIGDDLMIWLAFFAIYLLLSDRHHNHRCSSTSIEILK